ncbi:MAG: hypothetical protein WC542_04285 [Paludibacter sp.]
MYRVGAILYGLFDFQTQGKKKKYVIILHRDNEDFILTTFTTSQDRSGAENPVHGANPTKTDPKSYVFKAEKEIGLKPDGNAFSFKKDTTIVPDYGFSVKTIEQFNARAENLIKVCQLYPEEYIDLIYVLYKSKKTSKANKVRFEKILNEMISKK